MHRDSRLCGVANSTLLAGFFYTFFNEVRMQGTCRALNTEPMALRAGTLLLSYPRPHNLLLILEKISAQMLVSKDHFFIDLTYHPSLIVQFSSLVTQFFMYQCFVPRRHLSQ